MTGSTQHHKSSATLYDEGNQLSDDGGADQLTLTFLKNSEFRCHAMVQEVGPDGRVSTSFFHQDDGEKD